MFSNLMLFSNVLKFNDDKGKLEYLINGMKVFLQNSKSTGIQETFVLETTILQKSKGY